MSEKLSEYRRKRDFGATREPDPAHPDEPDGGRSEERRFVIQEHHATRLHWDLRLERDGVLASWAVPNGIPQDPQQNRKAVHTEDHPIEYLDFHGEIPKGSYGAGTMTIWDRGTYETHKWRDGEVMVTFHGDKVRGRYVLFRAGADEKDWMIHRMDPPADPERDPMPEHVVPMLAKLVTKPPRGDEWAFEIKWDGIRAIAYSEPGRLRLESRNLNDITAGYPELRPLNRALGSRDAVLDGEIVAFDAEGRPSFERIQQRMHLTGEAQVRRRARDVPVVYVIFDLLYLDGRDLMSLSYDERRARLAALELSGPHWRVPEEIRGDGDVLLEAANAQRLEGIVAKRVDCAYTPGRRSPGWLKIKVKQREELIIAGWLPGEGRRRDRIGALLVGKPDDSGLRFAGRVGTGFNEAELDRLARLLAPIERPEPPFTGGPKPPRGAIFVEPRHHAEIEFTEWTNEGLLRHPSYKGLVEPRREVPTTNRDKVMYPATGFTKGQVIDYYCEVGEFLLPHLHGRPLTLKRYPNGVDGQFFYEKNCPAHRPEWVRTSRVGDIDFCVVNDQDTLTWVANLASLELHTSLSLAERIERPTMMVFDLDPGEPAALLECCEVGLWLRGMFEGLGLQCFPKTSGSKGLQVYVPLNGDVTYDDTKPFARAVAETLERGAPELVVSRMTKKLRAGKVLVDWSQNDEHKTTVSVYSLRARERPTVSTPVTWEEVEAAHAAGDASSLVFEAPDVLRRVQDQGDLFAPVLTLRQALPGGGPPRA